MMNEVTLLDPPQLDRLLGNVDPEDMPDVVEELKAMHERLEQLPGQQYHNLLNDLSRSKQMLDDNYTELMNAFDHFEDNPGTWMAVDEEQVQHALMDFTRKLHNYLAM